MKRRHRNIAGAPRQSGSLWNAPYPRYHSPVHSLTLHPLRQEDIDEIAAAFAQIGWNKPAAQFERYLDQQERGERSVIVARSDGAFAGYLTVAWESGYPPFRDAGIPEIADFNVLPRLQRRGIGSALMEAAERLVGARSAVVGIGVGMTPDYGAAQRLYAKRGYLPDGRGLWTDDGPVRHGQRVVVDDSLVLHFTRALRQPH